ncbi:MAG: TonB-dependent receptor [Candidatus Didemnitutus sp.]|nr:TonB-dependent receptor [Candidatus Didemnitutus sp.]
MNSVVSCRHSRTLSFASALLFITSLGFAQTVSSTEEANPGPEAEKKAASDEATPKKEEILTLDPFVVSSTIAPRRKLDSAAAVTTIDVERMSATAPIGLPELLKQLPGVYVTSVSGEGRSNIYARGLPQTGGLVFVGLQQDGLPDISEMQFRNIWQDLMVRPSNFVERVENVRGGTSSVFMNNVPGGIINLITREGSDVARGEVLVGTSDYNQIKVEAWSSGPLADRTTMAAGVSYRRDDGIRSPGYTANKGYTLQGNVTHRFANGRGSVKLAAKWVQDYTVNITAIPLQNAQAPQAIPGGFPMGAGIIDSADLRYTVLPNTPLGTINLDTGKTGPKLATITGTLEYRLADTWKLQERLKYSNLVYNSATLLTSSVATPIQTLINQIGAAGGTQYAAAKSGANYSYRLYYPGQNGALIPDPSTLNGNGLAWTMTNNGTYSFIENYQNEFRVIKTLPNEGALALGLYNSWLDMPKAITINNTMLAEIRNNPRRLDVEFVNATSGASLGYATYQGIRQASVATAFRHYSTNQKTMAPFVSYEQQFGKWSIDAGARYQTKKETMVVGNRSSYNLNPTGSNILALRNAGFSNGTFTTASYDISATAWSVGANYRINSRLSAYGRVTSAYRMPISDDFYSAAAAGSSDPGPTNKVYSAETGVKYATRKLSIFGTLIASKLKDQLFSGLVSQSDGSLIERNVLRDTDSYGLELEVIYTPVKSLTFRFVGTEQRSKFANDAFVADPNSTTTAININGNRVTNIPQRYSTLNTTYRLPETPLGKPTVDFTWNYTGDIMVDEANRAKVAGYSLYDAGLTLKANKFTYRLVVKNLLDSDAIVNGDARVARLFADPTASYVNMRVALPRSIVGSVSYSF